MADEVAVVPVYEAGRAAHSTSLNVQRRGIENFIWERMKGRKKPKSVGC